MATPGSSTQRKAWSLLSRHGLLLESDATLPSVARIVAGEAIRGSWWSHRRSHEIFAAAETLSHHPDVLVAKLVAGKVTFLHRKLWPAFLAVSCSGATWQKRGLSPAARSLLRKVTGQGPVHLPAAPRGQSGRTRPLREAARDLERRLLVHSRQVHTESGSHARSLESWRHWMERMKVEDPVMEAEDGMRALEQAALALGGRTTGSVRLPWTTLRRRGG